MATGMLGGVSITGTLRGGSGSASMTAGMVLVVGAIVLVANCCLVGASFMGSLITIALGGGHKLVSNWVMSSSACVSLSVRGARGDAGVGLFRADTISHRAARIMSVLELCGIFTCFGNHVSMSQMRVDRIEMIHAL